MKNKFVKFFDVLGWSGTWSDISMYNVDDHENIIQNQSKEYLISGAHAHWAL